MLVKKTKTKKVKETVVEKDTGIFVKQRKADFPEWYKETGFYSEGRYIAYEAEYLAYVEIFKSFVKNLGLSDEAISMLDDINIEEDNGVVDLVITVDEGRDVYGEVKVDLNTLKVNLIDATFIDFCRQDVASNDVKRLKDRIALAVDTLCSLLESKVSYPVKGIRFTHNWYEGKLGAYVGILKDTGERAAFVLLNDDVIHFKG